MRIAATVCSVALGITISFVPGSRALPCCMVPRDYKGAIGQSAQEAIIFHADGREELILKIHYKIKGEGLPDRFAWVITVPNEPDAYATADPKLFEAVYAWAQPLVELPTLGDADGRGPPAAAAKEKDDGLDFGKAVKVGPYDIQPVRALGREALDGLNKWLDANGFPTEDPKHMAYFVDRKFTFLCVKVSPPKGTKSVEAAGGLPPLHLSFKSETPYYPLRFSSRQGVFDVNLYVLTKKEFDYEKSSESLQRIRFARGGLRENVEVKPASFRVALAEVYGKTAFKADRGSWRLNVLRTKRVNQGNTIAAWKEDIFFRTRV